MAAQEYFNPANSFTSPRPASAQPSQHEPPPPYQAFAPVGTQAGPSNPPPPPQQNVAPSRNDGWQYPSSYTEKPPLPVDPRDQQRPLPPSSNSYPSAGPPQQQQYAPPPRQQTYYSSQPVQNSPYQQQPQQQAYAQPPYPVSASGSPSPYPQRPPPPSQSSSPYPPQAQSPYPPSQQARPAPPQAASYHPPPPRNGTYPPPTQNATPPQNQQYLSPYAPSPRLKPILKNPLPPQKHAHFASPPLSSSTSDRSPSPERSVSRDRRRRDGHSGHRRHHSSAVDGTYDRDYRGRERSTKKKADRGFGTFVGAGGGALIGDLIFPGLGTAGGALLGAIGGREYEDKKGRRRGASFNDGERRGRY